MKASEMWQCDHFTECRWLYGPRYRALLVQRKVSRGMVVGKVGIECSFEMAFIENDDVV